jgi:pyruvate/2-oxoglutarate dehydrogenase complex dihydrolipoamide acyltransferase (E2) component
MIVEVIMPKLGMYEDDVTLVDWIASDGDAVATGDPLFVMETEKVETEIECEDDGILVTEAAAGFAAPIGSRIGYIVSTPEEHRELRAKLDGAR